MSALKRDRPDDRDAIIAHAAGTAYREIVGSPDGQAAVAKLLMDRYLHPVITRVGDVVRVDLGVIAGTPQSSPRNGEWVQSPLRGDGFTLRGAEVLRNLTIALVTQPGASTYQIEVDIPSHWPVPLPMGWAKGGYTYVYRVDEQRIRVYQNDKPSTYEISPRLDVGTVPDTLDWTTLEQRPMDRLPERSFDRRRRPQ